jgi:hypothetical protein
LLESDVMEVLSIEWSTISSTSKIYGALALGTSHLVEIGYGGTLKTSI